MNYNTLNIAFFWLRSTW